MNQNPLSLAYIWLIAIPLLSSPLVYLVGRLGKVERRLTAALSPALEIPERRVNWKMIPRLAALVMMLICWIPFVLSTSRFLSTGPARIMVGSIPLQIDGISLLLAFVALALGTLVTLFSGPYLEGEIGEEKYYAMLLSMVGVMIGLGCAGDLFNLWVWFEAMAVSSYLLVVFQRDEPASLEAGVKYVVQSATGSVLVLFGIAMVLSQAGTLDLAEIPKRVTASPELLAAGGLFLVGFGVKAALVPLHTWLPDAHTQAPSGISAMLSGVVIEAGLIAMLRALAGISGMDSYSPATWGWLLMVVGVLNMVFGNLMALRQKHVKRLLAFSSLSHVGYMVFGLGVALYGGQAAGAQGGLFHLINHGLMKGLAFLAAGAFLYAIGHAGAQYGRETHGPLTIADLDGAANRYPLAALAFSIAMLGLGGLPPLAGFMSKWQIFVAGFATRNLAIELLVIFAALNSVLSLAYYAPLVNAVYRNRVSPAVAGGTRIPGAMMAPIVLLGIAVVVIGLWPGLMQWLTGPASQALMALFGMAGS